MQEGDAQDAEGVAEVLEGEFGGEEEGADADLVVLEAREVAGRKKVGVEQVWKFGVRVCDGDDDDDE